MGRSETLPYLQKEWMSMLKTHEGESKIKPKKGEKCQPSSLSLNLFMPCGLKKQGSQGERKRKLQEGHLWRDVHEKKEVVPFFSVDSQSVLVGRQG